MGHKAVFAKNKTLYGRTILMALMAIILSGCGGGLLGSKTNDISSVIWKHRDQFVRIENQDQGESRPPANDHPATIAAEQIQNMLGSLDATFEGKEKAVALFSLKELEILGDAISTGLTEAGPRQDVTFAIAGVHREFISFSTDRSISTYRAFIENGKFNLIIGTLHEEYIDNVERRMYPLIPGRRKYTPPNPRRIIRTFQIVPQAGLENKVIDGRKREDWLVMDINPELWKSAIAEKKEVKETAKAAFREASEVRQESAQLEAEQQELRAEIQEMKRAIQQMQNGSTVVAPAPVPAATATTVTAPAPAPAATAAPADYGQIEKRLDILKRLKSKGLISDEEYQTKKQEILDSL